MQSIALIVTVFFALAGIQSTNADVTIIDSQRINAATEQLLAKLAEHGVPLLEDELLCNCTGGVLDSMCFMKGLYPDEPSFRSMCRTGPKGICRQSISKWTDGTEDIHYGCLPLHQMHPEERPFACESGSRSTLRYFCCRGSHAHFCNSDIKLKLPSEQPADVLVNQNQIIIIFIGICICALLIIIIYLILRYRVYMLPQWRLAGAPPILVDPLQQRHSPPDYYAAAANDDGSIPLHETDFHTKLLLPGCAGRRGQQQVVANGSNDEDDFDGAKVAYQLDRIDNLIIQACKECSVYSNGSGAAYSTTCIGLPRLVQRTIARQIRLKNVVGEGRYGQVHLGDWLGDAVAVKVFASRDEASFFREAEIYSKASLRHPNVLRFIAADTFDHGIHMGLWLVTEFIHNGSLCDYLTVNTIDGSQLLKMMRGIISGLGYLHTAIDGSCSFFYPGKPAIAHRDLKSKNILVTASGECVVADLGMAVKYQNGTLDLPINAKSGTIRYMAPEFLDNSFNTHQFESYQMGDIYALALVFWEMANRTNIDGKYGKYELPYHDTVGGNPGFDEMKMAVCTNNIRPTVPDRWHSVPILDGVGRLMKECWTRSPQSRLNAVSIRKAIDRISSLAATSSMAATTSDVAAAASCTTALLNDDDDDGEVPIGNIDKNKTLNITHI